MKMIKRRGRGRGSSDRFRSELLGIEKPFFWDVPMRSANGIGDSIGIANNHHCLENMSTSLGKSLGSLHTRGPSISRFRTW